MTAQKRNLVLVFDTNIFLTGIDFTLIPNIIYTTKKVIEEINVLRYAEKNRNILNKINAAIECGKLIIALPGDKYRERVRAISKKIGHLRALSEVDIDLIALALELDDNNEGVVVYTNDYSMENVCSELNIDFKPIYKKGIQSKWDFEVYCPFCKTIYESERSYTMCDRCSIMLKRRPIVKK